MPHFPKKSTQKPRFSVTVKTEAFQWLLREAQRLGTPKTKVVERLIDAEIARSPNAIMLELEPELLELVQDLAARERRSFEAQAAWMIQRYLEEN
jgi:hypothetical protein